MSVMVGVATTRAQAKREAVTKPLRVPDIERHVGVDREQLIKLQQEDRRILALVDAGRTSRRGGKIVSFEKARGIVCRRYQDLGRNVDVKQVVLPKPLREYVMSVAHDSITGAHFGTRRTKDKVLSNFYWPEVDGDVTRYCRSCDVCRRTVKKGTVPRVPLEKVQGRQKHYYDRTAKRRKFFRPPRYNDNRKIFINKHLPQLEAIWQQRPRPPCSLSISLVSQIPQSLSTSPRFTSSLHTISG
ncbi:gypsy retrotransposon integrase-like protein 1 [Plakobranchus ocellatus]|uniref:Gypsy retrotransposon integrase-like protein 1 n=1 Tax=Plakobranchus ocellatus TaxID=259542 RepID=A0AAV3ZNA1_9GAST|nr:gypsy retrotransposon integrase-like protein 1 [Plakobranchus ocellatus]